MVDCYTMHFKYNEVKQNCCGTRMGIVETGFFVMKNGSSLET